MQTLTTEKVKEMHANNQATLINVLDEQQFQIGHIPGSINIPVDAQDFELRVERTAGNKDRPVVVYCAGQECDASNKAARKLELAGFAQVFDYAGGTREWHGQGLPIEEIA